MLAPWPPCGLVYKSSVWAIFGVSVNCRNHAERITLRLSLRLTRARKVKALSYGSGLEVFLMIAQEKPSGLVRWSIVRLNPRSECEVFLLSGSFVRLVTHFFERTFLCPEDQRCQACQILPGRAYYYLPCLGVKQSKPGLLEMSCTASMDLEQACAFARLEVSAGVHLLVSRPKPSRPMRVEVLGFREEVPQSPFHVWVTALMAVYGLPALVEGESLAEYSGRVIDATVARANLAAEIYAAGRTRRPVSPSR